VKAGRVKGQGAGGAERGSEGASVHWEIRWWG